MASRPKFDEATGRETWLTNPDLALAVVDNEESKAASRQAENRAYLRCYWDRPYLPSRGYGRSSLAPQVFDELKSRHGGNLTAAVVDAAKASLCRQLASEVLPLGADFELEMGCRQASRLIEGVFDNVDFLNIATRCAGDGMTADVGPAKGYIDPISKEIGIERLDPLCVGWVDDGTDDPITVFTDEPASRDAMAAQYPDKADEIKRAPSWSPKAVEGVDPPGTRDNSHTVRRVEMWSRKVGNTPGKRVLLVAGDDGPIILSNGAEDWNHEATPVFWFRWQDDFGGAGGKSLTRIVAPWDSDRRRLMKQLYGGLAGAVPIIVEQENSMVSGLSDVPFHRMKYAGNIKPEITIPATVSTDVVAQIERIERYAFAEGGVNQNMATGSAPARYTSAVAQREFVDIANQRLLLAQKQWERFWKQAAKVVVMLAAHAKTTYVRTRGAKFYQAVTLPSLPKNKYRVHFGLSSGLSLTPAGRLQQLQDLKDSGVIDVADMLRHLDLPDTRQLADRVNAPRDLIMQQINRALDEGVPEVPSAMQDLPGLVKVATEEYQRARLQGTYPPKNMEALRRLILQAQARLAPAPTAPANDVAATPVAVPPVDPAMLPAVPMEPAPMMAGAVA